MHDEGLSVIDDSPLLPLPAMRPSRVVWEPRSQTSVALQEIFLANRLVGPFPFGHDFQVTLLAIVSSLGAYFVCMAYSTSIMLYSFKYNSLSHIFLDLIGFFADLLRCGIFFWTLSNTFHFKRLKEELQRIENVVSHHGKNFNWSSKKFYIFTFMITPLIAIGCLTINRGLNFIFQDPQKLLIIRFIIAETMDYDIVAQFICIQFLIRSLLKQILAISCSRDLVVCLESVYTVVELLNCIYGWMFAIVIVGHLSIILHHLFKLFLDIFEYFKMIWVIVRIIPLIAAIVSSEMTQTQIKRLNKIVYGRVLARSDDEILDFHLIARREMVFSACGFFNLDNSLICSMIGAGTTYLVILLQYSC